jgi:methyl acetate hydrolase
LCLQENLIHTPLTEQPGTRWQYGNSAEWLALLLPHILQAHDLLPHTLSGDLPLKFATEGYLQENVLKPLGMRNTTYYPFGEEFEGRLMPLRWYDEEKKGYEELMGQCDLLKLPRR